MAARLIQLEEPKSAEEDVVRAGKALGGQDRGQHAAAGGLAGLQALGQRAIHDALAVPGGLAERDTQRIHHLLHVQAEQLARGRRGAEHAHGRRAMPAAIDCRGKGHAARHIEPECDRQTAASRPDTPPSMSAIRQGSRRAPMRPDGSNRHDRACRRNRAHAPCWRSAARPAVPAAAAATASPGSAARRPSRR